MDGLVACQGARPRAPRPASSSCPTGVDDAAQAERQDAVVRRAVDAVPRGGRGPDPGAGRLPPRPDRPDDPERPLRV
ncbi:MAG: hypothetical protein WKG07_36180 [Hymenobacter sp.]